MEYEYEVKLQEFKFLSHEKDALYKNFNETVYGLQQKVGLKNLILEKKVETIEDNIEAKDLQLNQALGLAAYDPIGRTLDEVLANKDLIIQELES